MMLVPDMHRKVQGTEWQSSSSTLFLLIHEYQVKSSLQITKFLICNFRQLPVASCLFEME
jgi:hypothetical protein